jgi:hypothetical protein
VRAGAAARDESAAIAVREASCDILIRISPRKYLLFSHRILYDRLSSIRYHVSLKRHRVMTNAETAAMPTEPSEIPGMLATLCSYENFFGPFHPRTLLLMTALAVAYRQAGDANRARRLLEKVIEDSARRLGPEHAVRVAATEALRDLFIGQGESAKAAAAQRELLECRIRLFGSEHPETSATRDRLCEILMGTAPA